MTFSDHAPPPTEDICNAFNELRSDLVLLSELRQALATCTFELESLKHQYETACPGKVCCSCESIAHASDFHFDSYLFHYSL